MIKNLIKLTAFTMIMAVALTSCGDDDDEGKKPNKPVSAITIAPADDASVEVGKTVTLSVTITPEDATNKSVTWESLNADIATVSEFGIVTGIKAGIATIRATAADGSGVKADKTVTVKEVESTFIAVTSITEIPTAATTGTPLTLSGTVAPTNATNQTITWSITDARTTGATINGSTFNAVDAGIATVRATIANGTSESTDYTQDFDITVTTKPVDPGTSTETKEEFDNSNFGLYKGVIVGSSGIIKIEINNGDNVARAYLTIDGETDELICIDGFINGQAIEGATFTGTSSTFTFSVDADGKNPAILNINIEGHSDVTTAIIKETSTNVVFGYEGTSVGGNDHTGVLNFIRNNDTYFGIQRSNNQPLTFYFEGKIGNDGSVSGSAKGYEANYGIEVTLNYSGKFDGDDVSGTWTTSWSTGTNSGTFIGSKTL